MNTSGEPTSRRERDAATTLTNVAGVLAAIKLGWELHPDETLTAPAQDVRQGQRHVVELIEEALSRV